ncbi:MAG: response regulator [Elusimicrobiota bacterium]
MSAIGLLAAETEDREELSLLLGELGHRVDGAALLDQAVESAREGRSRAFLVVDGGGADAEMLTRELVRAYPLMPVVVALKTRDATRAVALMRAGAFEVVAPPWTRSDLKACISKSLRFTGTALTPVRLAPRRRRAAWYALAVGAFFAVAIGVASLRRAEQLRRAEAAKVDHWDLPVSHPAGLAFDGKDLWVVDWFSQSLYQHSRADAKVLGLRHLSAETPVAAAFATDAVWTATADGAVVRRMKNDALTPLERFPNGAPGAAGIAFDGLYLWTLDAHDKVLRKHLLDATLTVLSTHRAAGLKPVALVWDGDALWTLDAGDRLLRRLDLERPEQFVAAIPLAEYGDGVYAPTGLAWDGERFWTVAERRDGKGPARLFRHRREGAP